MLHVLCVVIDFPENLDLLEIETAEIVLVIGVIIFIELIEFGDASANLLNVFKPKCLDTVGDHQVTVEMWVLTERIVEVSDGFSLVESFRGHGVLLPVNRA